MARLADARARALLRGSGITLASLVCAAIGWAAVLLAAGSAIASESRHAAIALVVAGAAAVLGLSLGALALRDGYTADNGALLTEATLALLASAAAGILAFVFAVYFRW